MERVQLDRASEVAESIVVAGVEEEGLVEGEEAEVVAVVWMVLLPVVRLLVLVTTMVQAITRDTMGGMRTVVTVAEAILVQCRYGFFFDCLKVN